MQLKDLQATKPELRDQESLDSRNRNMDATSTTSNDPVEPSPTLGSQTEVERQVTGLVLEIDRICKRLGGESSHRESEVVSNVVDQIDLCSKLLSQLDSTVGELRQRLNRVESHNHELNLQLQARANESQTDGLTGIHNRRSFDREFSERCITAQHSQCPLTLVFLDIDHFKSINDGFGHHVGDAVLRGLARLLKTNMPTGALLARYGGEEFAMIFTGLSIDDSIAAIESLRKLIRETHFSYEGQTIGLTISCGLAQLVDHEHCERLLQRADAAMYAAKQAGRNRTFWDNNQQLHPSSLDVDINTSVKTENAHSVVDLSSIKIDSATTADQNRISTNSLTRRTTRANWCDGAVLFWNIRQRIAEWKGGGEPFCVMATEIDDSALIAQTYGTMAFHFMMRAQLLHLDATLRDMDIVARIGSSRMVVVLPRSGLQSLLPMFRRLRNTMDRFAFPTANKLVEYSVSIGVTEASLQDAPQTIIGRAEEILAFAQRQGKGRFFANNSDGIREI